ncbi:Flagellar protein fliO [Cedecea davisae]|uniref:Flagellar protein n=1 Tax=Cedecea davisae DSM 4568 TaxID=566551 RepID=S3ITU2_9ENTR|nr:flagellar biosynthetic protein FliO [Cedecea davisae]EPF16410.1 flagellar biosynthetic protein FliO [Cedecea davisae DSM 4568]SUX38817.1 Flagellar protein fliO [Cedecea davisae]
MKTGATVSQPSVNANSPLVQVSGALAGIVIFILVAAWLAKRFGFTGAGVGVKKSLNISASVSVGPRERVVVIDVEDARLVLGVTATQITHLHTLPPAPVTEEAEAKPAPADFQKLMKNLLKRNGKD